MHWLGTACAEGGPDTPPNPGEALRWIAQAAALGHVIARRQMDALLASVGVRA